MKWTSLTVLFCLFLPACNAAKQGTIDLSGDWQLLLIECVKNDLNCEANLARNRNFTVRQPENLRELVPWFSGKPLLTKKFSGRTNGSSDDLYLFMGAIGSVDETWLNGMLIGQTGYASLEKNTFISSWMKVRYYRIPPKVLQPRENTLQITFYSIDPKSGVYLGPLLIGENSQMATAFLIQKFIREQYFYFVTSSVAFVFFFILATFFLQKLNSHFLVFSGAVAAFFCHSLYFMEMPAELPYDSFLKFQAAGRIISLYIGGFWVQYTLTGRTTLFLKITLPVVTCGLLVLLFTEQTIADVVIALRVTHGVAFIYLIGYLSWFALAFRTLKPRVNAGYLGSILLVQVFYAIDFANYMYWTNLPWLTHYFAGVFHLGFVIMQSHMLFEWEKTAFHYKLKLNEDRMRIARDIHDAIGSDLTQIIVQSKSAHEQGAASRLDKLARSALEKIRDMVFLLKNDQSQISIKGFIVDHTQFLSRNPRYRISLGVSDIRILPVANVNLQRIISEWLSNVIRHSKPGRIRILLKEKKQSIILIILDDGLGLTWDGSPNATGLGNIADRASRLNGSIFARRRSGHGLNAFCLRFPHETLLV